MSRNVIVALASASMLAAPVGAEAKGCVRGAVAGAVVGHYAGRHAVVGALGGCIAARAYYKNKAKAQRQKPQTTGQAASAQDKPQ